MNDKLVSMVKVAQSLLPTLHGDLTAHAFRSQDNGQEHLAITVGDFSSAPTEPVLVRMHSECLTGDVFGSRRCDCGEQLNEALARIVTAGKGVLLYLRGHEGRGIGIAEKIRAYALQDQGVDTVDANLQLGHPADARNYDDAAAMLAQLGICSIRLLTNNPQKITALEDAGITIVERIPLVIQPNPANAGYLQTKQLRMRHNYGVDTPEG
ncbi:GTP cyclohydrolase II [Ampullimonas aquatilis]|uniref:GTP cyclohydrolase II n=1 Tax=Ampullimonas aquatilis TaxID=1341549 RepID=UPI003C7083C9